MIGIDPNVIRRAASRFATVRATPTPQPWKPRDGNSLRSRVIRLAETVETFSLSDVTSALKCTHQQAVDCIHWLTSNKEIEIVVRGGGRIPGTNRGGKTAIYRRVKR